MPDAKEMAPHYWSYRALLEDKKRCLTDIPHVKHDMVNSLARQGEDHKVSQSAMAELKKHMRVSLEKVWDPDGPKTPPHAYMASDELPHTSARELMDKKKRMQTGLRKIERSSDDLGLSPTAGRVFGQDRPSDRPHSARAPFSWEAPTMGELMKPGDRSLANVNAEKTVLAERRDSGDPHQSQQVLNMKKRYHATKIHQKKPQRSQSAREFGSSRASDVGPDPKFASYQGMSNEAWPLGQDDPKKVGRYKSQAYLLVDKRRHAASLDGDAAAERARSRDEKHHGAERPSPHDGHGLHKPDFCARGEKYRSQYALAQHKRRHLAELHGDGEASVGDMPMSPYSDATTQPSLFTSHKNLEYGKRGHVVSLNSARTLREAYEDARSDGSSSCDVGKGISRMMHKHQGDDEVHVSQREFYMKKVNHATAVHTRPRPPPSTEGSEASSESRFGGACGTLAERRRPSDPHHSCKAYALKKKYHQTSVHAKSDSRLHPKKVKEDKAIDKQPKHMSSHSQLNNLKKMHCFDHNPADRSKPPPRMVPTAPVPRNGQWTPQHILD